MARNYDAETRMQKPDGTHVWVPTSEVPAFYKRGYTLAGKGTVPVRNIFNERETVDVQDLSNLFDMGYTLDNARQEVQDTVSQPIEPELSVGEKVGAFATSLDPTAGILPGLINKGIDKLAQADSVDETNTKLRELQAEGGAWSTAGQVASILTTAPLTGGLVLRGASAVGKAAQAAGAGARASRVAQATSLAGLSGLEGVGYSLVNDAGEAVLGNPDINAERILADAKSGFVWGAGMASAAMVAGRAVKSIKAPKKRAKAQGNLPDLNVSLLSQSDDGISNRFHIVDKKTGESVGIAELAVGNPNAIHDFGKVGVSLESFKIHPEFVGGRYEEAFLNEAIDKFGRVATSGTKGFEELPKNVREAFEVMGTPHTDANGARYFTAHQKVQAEISTADALIERYGNLKRKKFDLGSAEHELFTKFTRKSNPGFRKRVMEFYNEPVKVLKSFKKQIEGVNEQGNLVKSHSVALKKKMMQEMIPNEDENVLAAALHLDSVYKRIKAFNLSGNVNRAQYNPRVLAIYRQVGEAVNGISKKSNLGEIAEDVYALMQTQKSNMRRLRKSNADLIDADYKLMEDLVDDLDRNFLKNPDIMGKFAPEYASLQIKHAKLVEQAKKFQDRYLDKKTGEVLEEKVSRQLASKFDLKSSKASAEDAAYVNALSEYVNEAKKLSLDLGLDYKKISRSPMHASNRIDELKEIYDGAKLLDTMARSSEPGFFGGVATGALSAAGASAAGAVGTNWFVGAMLGQQAGRQMGGVFNNPVKMIQIIENLSGKTTGAARRIRDLTKVVTKGTSNTTAKSLRTTGYAAKYLGFGENQEKDYAKLRSALALKLQSVSPDVVQETEAYQELYNAAPQHTKALLDKQQAIASYIRANMPPEPRKYTDHREDMEKLDAIVEAAFDPEAALEKVMLTGDAGLLQHLREMYPALVDEAGSALALDLYDKELSERQSKIMLAFFPTNQDLQKEVDSFQKVYNVGQDNSVKPLDNVKPKIKASTKNFSSEGLTRADRLSQR